MSSIAKVAGGTMTKEAGLDQNSTQHIHLPTDELGTSGF